MSQDRSKIIFNFLTCINGTNLHNAAPNTHILVNAVIGVTIPDTKHTTISDTDNDTINIFRTDCNDRCLNTDNITSILPSTPNLKIEII